MIEEGHGYEAEGETLAQGDGDIPARGTDTVVGLMSSKFTVSW